MTYMIIYAFFIFQFKTDYFTIIYLFNNYLLIYLKQEIELLIPAQTGNVIINKLAWAELGIINRYYFSFVN